jgi:hypothetical protein
MLEIASVNELLTSQKENARPKKLLAGLDLRIAVMKDISTRKRGERAGPGAP